MLTMHHPFETDHDEAMKYAIRNTEPQPLARYKKGVSDGLQRIIDKAIEKNLDTRYQSAADFAADLKRETKVGDTDSQPTIVLGAGGARKPHTKPPPQDNVADEFKALKSERKAKQTRIL